MLNVKLIDCDVNLSTRQLTFVHHSLLQRLCYAFALEQRHKSIAVFERCTGTFACYDVAVDSTKSGCVFGSFELVFKTGIACSTSATQQSEMTKHHGSGTDSTYQTSSLSLTQYGMAYTFVHRQSRHRQRACQPSPSHREPTPPQ